MDEFCVNVMLQNYNEQEMATRTSRGQKVDEKRFSWIDKLLIDRSLF